MHVDIAYVRDKQLINSATVYKQSSEKDKINMSAVKAVIRDFIHKNAYYYAKASVIESHITDNHKVIVDNCVPTKIRKIVLCNTNVIEELDLSDVERDLNYVFANKIATKTVLANAADQVYDKLVEKFFIVKDLKMIIDLLHDAQHSCDIICNVFVGTINPNAILTVNSNSDVYVGSMPEDIKRIYSEFFTANLLGYGQLRDNLAKYINHHTFIKQINIFFQVDSTGRQIIDNRLKINLLAYLGIYNTDYWAQIGQNLQSYTVMLMDGNLLNRLYFRLIKSIMPGILFGANLRYKINMGYKRTIYLGSNLYLGALMPMSDLNIVGKMKYFLNNRSCLVTRLNLRYYFAQAQKLHVSGVLGFKVGEVSLVFSLYDMFDFYNYRAGLTLDIALYSKFLSKIRLFVGSAVIVDAVNSVGSIDYHIPYADISAVILNFNFNCKLMLDSSVQNYKLSSTLFKQAIIVLSITKRINKICTCGMQIDKLVSGIKYRPYLKLTLV